MNELYQLKKSLSYYYNLKESVNRIINILENSIDSANNASLSISKYYSLNSESADGNSIRKLKKDLSDKNDYLKRVVLLEINYKIKYLKKKISDYENKII